MRFLFVCVLALTVLVPSTALFAAKGPLASAYKKIQEAKQPLPKIFDDNELGYSIRYPADWAHERPGKYHVVFGGKEGTRAYLSTVSIQNLASVKQGGVQDSLDSVRKTYIRQLKNPSEGVKIDVKISEERPYPYSREGRAALRGTKFMSEFTAADGTPLKQWTVIIERSAKEAYYVWSYVSPSSQFDDYIKVASDMLDSWNIK